MKKHFKGFTLIECIVAMAILGVASLLIAQIYGAVSMKNKTNNLVNTSLVNQMAYVEKYTNSDVVALTFAGGTNGGQPPHRIYSMDNNNGYSSYVMFTSNYDYKNYNGTSTYKNVYSHSADVYVLQSRVNDGSGGSRALSDGETDSGYTEQNFNLRYRYLLGHSN